MRYITHEQAVAEFKECGEVWYMLDPVNDGVTESVVSEDWGDIVEDVIEERRYFITD